MSVQTPVADDDPRMIAWRQYIDTAEFEISSNRAKAVDVEWEQGSNAVQLTYPNLDDALCAVFIAGFEAREALSPATPIDREPRCMK